MKQTTLSVLKNIDKKLSQIVKMIGEEIPNTTELDTPKWWVLEMKKEFTATYLWEECKKLFDCYTHIDLSKIKSDRSGDYVIEFSPTIEADEKWKNISANDLPKTEKFITLEERMLLEIQYFKATGKHLDIENWTLATGSRCLGGYVPCVYRFSDKFQVSYCNPDGANDGIASRSAVHFSL